MDIKIEIKEDDPFSDDLASQNKRQLEAAVTTNNNAAFNCDDMTVKTEIKSGTPFSDFSLQNEGAFFSRHQEKQIKLDTVTGSKNSRMTIKTEIEEQTLISDFGTPNKTAVLQEDSVIQKKYSSDHEVDNKTGIKEECWWQEIQIKDEDFPPVNSPRACIEAAPGDTSGESSTPSAEDLRKNPSLCMGEDSSAHGYLRNSKGQGSYVTEKHFVEINIHSEPSSKYGYGEIYSKGTQMLHKCVICGKKFTRSSDLKRHNLIHEGKKPHKCTVCGNRFRESSNLKIHYLIHEGKKPHRCAICEKRFTLMSALRRHNLIHEGKKPHKCTVCKKRFRESSNLKIHCLIHEGKKPHRCLICEKTFTQLSHLKGHSLIHEGNKPHQCEICEKKFIRFSQLRSHRLIHEAKQPEVLICEKRFT